MKTFFIIASILLVLFALFQYYTIMSISKTETQAYKVITVEKNFEIRYYPAATMATINSKATSYRELGNNGFQTLAKYIFGGNSENKQIAMTSPVHMNINDSSSTMAFVLPASYNETNLPRPNDNNIAISTSKPEYVAAIKFGGFANTASIKKYSLLLENLLKEKELTYSGNFRFLGYNPPFQFIGRKNEIIVALNENELNNK